MDTAAAVCESSTTNVFRSTRNVNATSDKEDFSYFQFHRMTSKIFIFIIMADNLISFYIKGACEFSRQVGTESYCRFESATDFNISANLARYYELVNVLNHKISIKLNDYRWQEVVEGSCMNHFEKIETLQTLAADSRVEKICEIGISGSNEFQLL